MFRICDGRSYFYQWDLDRKLIVEDSTIDEVHFCNRTDDCSLVCKPYDEDGARLVDVPNILLQNDWDIRVYAYDVNYTKHEGRFEVKTRTKPADYIYTEVELESWDKLEARMEHVEEVVLEQNVGAAVLEFLETNPELRGPVGEVGPTGEPGVYVGEVAPEDEDILVWVNPEGEPTTDLATQRYVQEEIAKVTGVDLSDYYTKEEVDEAIANIEVSGGDVDLSNYYTKEEVDEALTSIELTPGPQGEPGYTPVKGVDYFDGKDGQDGAQGPAGYTPVKGVDYFDGVDGKDGKDGADGRTPEKGIDYFTEQDKAELVSSVVAALPVYNGEVVNG